MATMLSGTIVGASTAQAADDDAWSGQGKSFTSTQTADGTFLNAIIGSDVPDVATIRIPAGTAGASIDTYYMISTTMELTPGAPILRSYDLVNWEIVNYVYDVMEVTDTNALRNGYSAYGQGQWASTLRYHDGTFYVVMNSNNNGHAYLFTTTDIEGGQWDKFSYNRSFHDPNIFFDGDTPYIVYGSSSTQIAQMSPDLHSVISDRVAATTATAINNTGLSTTEVMGSGWEGNQVEYINGYYYILGITWGKYGRQAIVLRSRSLLGSAASDPYEVRVGVGSNLVAQGGFIGTGDSATPQWALLFGDDYPTGRIPVLVPVAWDAADPDAWPVFGTGVLGSSQVPLPGTQPMPVTLSAADARTAQAASVVTSDQFSNDAAPRDFRNPNVPAPEVVVPESRGEHIANGTIEAGTTGWQALGGASLSLGYSTRHQGAMSLKVNGRTTDGAGASQAVTTLQRGSTYAVSAWVHYRDAGSDPATFAITLSDGKGHSYPMAQASVPKGSASAPTTFVQVAGEFTVPDELDVATAKVSIVTAGSTTVPDIFFVDDVSMVGDRPVPDYYTSAEGADNGSHLALPWQWGHNVDNRYWSLTDRDGWLRLTNGRVVTGAANKQYQLTYFEEARNTLSQRTFAPASSAQTRLDFSGLKDGDVSGLAVYNRQLSYIGVAKKDGVSTLGIVNRPVRDYTDQESIATVEDFLASVAVPQGVTSVSLKADLNMRKSGADRNTVRFYYSWDGVTWQALGDAQAKRSSWESKHFKGQRFGLFSYATQTSGGHADFDDFSLSDVLTADGRAVDTADLDWLVREASRLDERDYTAPSWAKVQKALSWATSVAEPSTQNEVDAPAQALNSAIASLEDGSYVAPVVTATVASNVPEVSGWYRGAVSVTLALNERAKADIEYRQDGGEWKGYAGEIVVAASGAHQLDYRASEDGEAVAGSGGTASFSIDVDAPVTTAVTDAAARTVTMTAVDAHSGLARIEYRIGDAADWSPATGAVVVGDAATVVGYRAVDLVGNLEAARTVTVPAASTSTPTPGGVLAPAESDLTAALEGAVTAPSTVRAGASLTLTVPGVQPGAPVHVWMFSTPTYLGQATVTTAHAATVTVPAGMSLGAHRVVVADADGTVIGWAPITVTAGDDALAVTGGDATTAVSILLTALVLLGLGALLVRRRRRGSA
ncbi:family 43 glycosylhydrolase [Microbacterium hominis]|nr:family 43 glycosylhydrolase [Microbacterium hominis]